MIVLQLDGTFALGMETLSLVANCRYIHGRRLLAKLTVRAMCAMCTEGLNAIKYAVYRMAMKLRSVQKTAGCK